MRILPAEEWDKLTDIFKANDWWLPEPTTAFALVEEDDDGEIVFVMMVQLGLLAEPMWAREDHRGKIDWRAAVKEVEAVVSAQQLFPGVMLHSENDATAHMAEQFGMREVPVRTFVRQFEKAATATAREE